MPAPRSPRRARLAVLVAAALAFTGLQFLVAAPAAQAVGSTGLVINEVYGGGGNSGATYLNDFVEIYNPTASTIALSGKSLQYRAAATLTASANVYSFGAGASVAPGGYYLVQCASAGANGVVLPVTADATNCALNLSGTNGQIYLADTTAGIAAQTNAAAPWTFSSQVIDFVGFGTAAVFEGAAAAPAPSGTASISRSGTHADTDVNSADFTSSTSMTPTAAGPAPLAGTNPGTQNSVTGTAITPLSMAATGGTSPYHWTDPTTSLPSGLSVTDAGVVSGTPSTVGNYSVTLHVTDNAGSPASTDVSFTWNVTASIVVTPIKDIQGTTATSPVAGQTVTTEGKVTASYPTGGLNGFYIQSTTADAPNASDALFVFGGAGFTAFPAVGDSVRVTGAISEFSGLTEMTIANNGDLSTIANLGTVPVKTTIPGSDCALPGDACPTGSALDDPREAMEGEIIQPTDPWTLTDIYDGGPAYNPPSGTNSSSNFGELGVVANSSAPLVAPTEVIDAQDTANIAKRVAYNNAHRIILDDGSGTNYTTATGQPFPWMSQTSIPRVGAALTFPAPVVFTWGFGVWRLEPSSQVVGAPSGTQPQFTNGRTGNGQPADVGGDLKLATFNVLNFFPTTGEDFVANLGGSCTYFNDRQGNHITNNQCTPNGPRGAADAANLARQQEKIVAAINTANADIVSLEELENSIQYGPNRDAAIQTLVTALNADAGAGTWAFAPSPTAANLPPTAQQDVIRTGFIYKPAKAALVGDSVVLSDQSGTGGDFEDAREPLAQAFKKAGAPDSEAFAVIVNHFKSKGSGTPDPNGQGNANNRRILQAQRLVTFANDFKALRGLTKVFLVGDFNAYSDEDPIQVLEAAGYTNLESTVTPGEKSYNFDGMVGALDHVLANTAANAMVNAVDVWTINSYESVYYEYSRYNYNVTDLYMSGPFRSSDHNPEIVGLNTTPVEPATRDIQILGTNDFHGRIQNDATSATAGAAVLAGAVKQLKNANPDTVFAAAGDLIGASTFESFIAKDKPTIDALNEAKLDVSSVGNHEFDQGFNDLTQRVMAPYDATTNPFGGANWQYIGANIRKNSDDSHALAPTWTKTFGSVKVGFIGAVTEHLPELVSPSGISQIHVTDIVNEVNASANDLEAGGADVIVLLVHEGAANTNCATMDDDPSSDFGSIINGVNDNVDAIVSGHTHLLYNCSFPVAGWSGRPVTDRPVVSAGQYGMALNQLVYTVDTASGDVLAKSQAVLPLKTGQTPNYPADPATASIVSAAVANAAVLGAQPLGNLGGPFFRGKLADGTTENRGAESTLGNLVAEVQRWATRNPESGSAQIAFMNPGGLRQDMVGTGSGTFPRVLTYQQAAVVQPFANTLVNEKLTGAQIKTVLEQQWQAAGASRPFLKLGISKGFTYTATPPPAGSPAGTRGTVTGMWLNGTPIDPSATYSVTVNSFLSSGGDGFTELNNGLQKQDTGKTDLQGMVDYMAAFGSGSDVVNPDYKQNGVQVVFPAAAPASYAPGDHLKLDVSGWSMTNAGDLKDTAITLKIGSTVIGTATLDNTAQAALPGFDVTGMASVDVVVPGGITPGAHALVLSGATTGSESQVPVTLLKANAVVDAPDVNATPGAPGSVTVTVSAPDVTPTGTVVINNGATFLGSATLAGGQATINLPALPDGTVLTAKYSGDGFVTPGTDTFTVHLGKATPVVTAIDTSVQYGKAVAVTVNVAAPNGLTATGTVTVRNGGTTLGTGTVSGGTATVTIPARSLPVGTANLTAAYSGDADLAAGTDSFTVSVSKATSTTKATVKPTSPTIHQKVKLTVQVEGSDGVEATGQVTIKVGGKTVTKTLTDGTLKLNLGRFGKGKHKVKVAYLGSASVEGSTDTVKFTVS